MLKYLVLAALLVISTGCTSKSAEFERWKVAYDSTAQIKDVSQNLAADSLFFQERYYAQTQRNELLRLKHNLDLTGGDPRAIGEEYVLFIAEQDKLRQAVVAARIKTLSLGAEAAALAQAPVIVATMADEELRLVEETKNAFVNQVLVTAIKSAEEWWQNQSRAESIPVPNSNPPASRPSSGGGNPPPSGVGYPVQPETSYNARPTFPLPANR